MNESVQPNQSCPVCGDHRYNCPLITPFQFLKAVQSDSSVPLRDRMKAAVHLLRLKRQGITSDPIEPEPAYTIIIPDVTIQ
jgi:hypothetical protein